MWTVYILLVNETAERKPAMLQLDPVLGLDELGEVLGGIRLGIIQDLGTDPLDGRPWLPVQALLEIPSSLWRDWRNQMLAAGSLLQTIRSQSEDDPSCGNS